MPYEFNWESSRTVCVRFFGVVTDDDLSAATHDLYNNERSDLVREAYWDFSSIDDFIINPESVEQLAIEDFGASTYMKPMKAAFIIQHSALAELADGYIGTMETLGSPWKNRLFSTMEEARKWMAA